MELYQIYSINYFKQDEKILIDDFNNEVGIRIKFYEDVFEFKKNINFKELITSEYTLKNEEIKEYIHENRYKNLLLIDENLIINLYLSKIIIHDILIEIIFYEFINPEIITAKLLNENTLIKSILDRNFKFTNSISKMEKNFFEGGLKKIIKEISQPKLSNYTNISIENLLKTKLFLHQKGNINWMLDLEKRLDIDILIQRYLYFPDGRIYSIEGMNFVSQSEIVKLKINGGIIFDDVGTGKTLQFICLALSKPDINTLILVPDHLYDYWNDQFIKHLNIPMPQNISIIGFNKYLDYTQNYDRIIVDEIHELYSNPNNLKIFYKVVTTPCTYKWGLTGTLIPVEHSMFYILEFITSNKLYTRYIEMYSYVVEQYPKFIRKNKLENIQDIVLPDLNIIDVFVEFSNKERIIYDSEITAETSMSIDDLRKICCDVTLTMENCNNILFSDFNTMIAEMYEKKWLSNKEKLDILIDKLTKLERLRDNLLTPNEQINNNILHFRLEIQKQQIIVVDRLRSYNFLKNQFAEIIKCPVCLSDIEPDINCSIINVPDCNHAYCQTCLEYLIQNFRNKHKDFTCAICRRNFLQEDVISINNGPVNKYPAKFVKLLEILSSSDNKFIIYTQYEKISNKINKLLTSNNIKNIIYSSYNDINIFKEENYQVIILNSTNMASGLDFSFVNNMIIFEPIAGNYSYLKDIEKQIIGRIHRYKQTKVSNVYRLIIKNTIEEELYQQIN